MKTSRNREQQRAFARLAGVPSIGDKLAKHREPTDEEQAELSVELEAAKRECKHRHFSQMARGVYRVESV
jgi:hypothetical protein